MEIRIAHRFSATFFLANIRSYHDGRLDRAEALEFLRKLHTRHPHNSLVHFELIEVLTMLERYEEVIPAAAALETHPGTSRQDRGRVNMARVWRARAELMLGRPDRAWEILEPLGSAVETPNWGDPWIHVTRAQILDTRGQREQALGLYRRVALLELPTDEYRAARIAEEGLAAPFSLEPATPALATTP